MKKLRKNSGFTLVECLVAMAVLAVMTVGLMMILNATVRQRNHNMQLERDVDKQVEQVINQDDTVVTKEDVADIKISDDMKISGVQKVYSEDADSDLQIGVFSIPLTGTPGGVISSGAVVTKGQSPSDLYKVYGANKLAGDEVSISCSLTDTKGPSTGTDIYKYIDSEGKECTDFYYDVKWNIRFKVMGDVSDELSVKVVLPPSVKILECRAGRCCKYVHELGNNTVRIQAEVSGEEVAATVIFRVPASEYESAKSQKAYLEDHFGVKDDDLDNIIKVPINKDPEETE